jgi:hypothetical protein
VPLTNLPYISVDAAVIKPPPGLRCGNELDCGTPHGVRDLWVRDDQDDEPDPIPVRKHGAETQLTYGELTPIVATMGIEDVQTYYNSGWWVDGNGSQFADEGDSGSVVVDDERRIVGMVVAAHRPENGGAAFVHGIKQIFSALRIGLL